MRVPSGLAVFETFYIKEKLDKHSLTKHYFKMKKALLLLSLIVFAAMGLTSCKKCQTCTTTVEQTILGIYQETTVSDEYCGSDYDNAPAETTVTNNIGGIDQKVTITCEKS